MLYLTVGIDSQNRFVKYPKVSEKKNLMEGKLVHVHSVTKDLDGPPSRMVTNVTGK